MAKNKIKRKVSRITVPLDDSGAKDFIEAFRTTKGIRKALAREENKSETINKALSEYYARELMECPTCKGKGQIRAHNKHK